MKDNYCRFNIVMLVLMASVILWMLIRQEQRDYLQDKKMDEWMSNTAATLEGMEYEVSKLMSESQNDTLYGK